jgi:hypothetical protein
MKFPSKKFIFYYSLLILVFFFLANIFWNTYIVSELFYCPDSFPVLNFFPPFIQAAFVEDGVVLNRRGVVSFREINSSDFYIVDKSSVMAIWYLLLSNIIILPVIPAYFLAKNNSNSKKK